MKNKAVGFVIRSLDYGESDRIITFYTDTFGKLKGIAKGARRSTKRFANAIEPFSCSTIIFSRKNKEGLALVENCDVINHYPDIREDLERTLVASYLLELTDHFTVEGKKDLKLFQLLHHFLSLMEEGTVSEEIIRFFELRLLKLTGYEPVLERCIACDTPVARIDSPQFNVYDGGIRCTKCRRNNAPSVMISKGTVNGLIMGKEADITRINRISFSRQSLNESRILLASFIRHTLGKEPKSLQVLSEIKKLTASRQS